MTHQYPNNRNNKFFFIVDGQKSVEWDIWALNHENRGPVRYFSAVFQKLDDSLTNFNIYLTREEWRSVPLTGKNVIVVVFNDEHYRIPKYTSEVAAVFKCYGVHPIKQYILSPSLAIDRIKTRPFKLNLGIGMRLLSCLPKTLPLWLEFKLKQLIATLTGNQPPRVPVAIPLGYFNSENLTLVPLEERTIDIAFDGSLSHMDYSRWSLKHWISPPKIISRGSLIANLKIFQRQHPEYITKLAARQEYGMTQDVIGELSEYSLSMMQTKICCVPRGTMAESQRLFEAMRYGCIIFSQALPDLPFYRGAPFVFVNDWNQLESVATQLLLDPIRMQDLHMQTLVWWHDNCSESACARLMLKTLLEAN